jgi:hypothetical protein
MHRGCDDLLSRETECGPALACKVWLGWSEPSFRGKRAGAMACPAGLQGALTMGFVCKEKRLSVQRTES